MSKKVSYASLSENNKNLVDLLEGLDSPKSGKRAKDFAAEVIYTVKGETRSQNGTFIFSEGTCKTLKYAYRGGIASLINEAEDTVRRFLLAEAGETLQSIQSVIWLPTESVVHVVSEEE